MDCADCHCMMSSQYKSRQIWTNPPCTDKYFFICATDTALKMSGNHTFTLRKEYIASPNFHLWWNQTLGDVSKGIAISWWIENGSLPLNDVKEFVSKDLSGGSVSTPGLGAALPADYNMTKHEYTAVIELPYNITDIIGDGVLVFDVDIAVAGNETDDMGVELSTLEFQPEFSYGSQELERF